MALYQPSNVSPSSFGGIGNGVVDVNDNVNITWQVNGLSQLRAFQIQIFKNNPESTPVYNTGVIGSTNIPSGSSSLPFYGTDSKGNPVPFSYVPGVSWETMTSGLMENGQNYKLKITQFFGSQNGVSFYSPSQTQIISGKIYYFLYNNQYIVFTSTVTNTIIQNPTFVFNNADTIFYKGYSVGQRAVLFPAYISLSAPENGTQINYATATDVSDIPECLEQYSESAFVTRSAPTIGLELNGESMTSGMICDKATATFIASYSQEQGDSINYVRWILASAETFETIEDTGEINTSDLQFDFAGLLNSSTGTTNYMIRCMVQTENGQLADTGFIDFIVSYDTESMTGGLTATCQKDGSVLLQWASAMSIPGTATGDYTLENKTILLPSGSIVKWDSIIPSGSTESEDLSLQPPYKLEAKLKMNPIFTDSYRLSSIDGLGTLTNTLNGIVFHPNGTIAVAYDNTGAYKLTFSGGVFTGTPVRIVEGTVLTADFTAGGVLIIGGHNLNTNYWGYTTVAAYTLSGSDFAEYDSIEFSYFVSDMSGDAVYSVAGTTDSVTNPDDFVVSGYINESKMVSLFHESGGSYSENIIVQEFDPGFYPRKVKFDGSTMVFVYPNSYEVYSVTNDTATLSYYINYEEGIDGYTYDAAILNHNNQKVVFVSRYEGSGESSVFASTSSSTNVRLTINGIVRSVLADGSYLYVGGSTEAGTGFGFINVYSVAYSAMAISPLFLRGTRNLGYSVMSLCKVPGSSYFACIFVDESTGNRSIVDVLVKNTYSNPILSISDGNLKFTSPDGIHIVISSGNITLGTTYVQGNSDLLNPEYAIIIFDSTTKVVQVYSIATNGETVISQGTLSAVTLSTYSPPIITDITLQGLILANWLYIESGSGVPTTTDPVWDENTIFYADFSDLQGGTAKEGQFSNGLYKYTNGGNVMKPVYFAPLSVNKIKDFGVPAGMVTDYSLHFMASDETLFQSFRIESPLSICYPFVSLIEAVEDRADPTVYHAVKVWTFSSNVSNTAVSNNNTPGWLVNFTPYRLRQPSAIMGRSGTLTGLLGSMVSPVNKGEWNGATTYKYLNVVTYSGVQYYAIKESRNVQPGSRGWKFFWSNDPVPTSKYRDTEEEMEELYKASEGNKVFFLKDKKGGFFMVSISSPITQTIQDNTTEKQVSVSIPWEEVGDASQISLIQLPTDDGWEE